MGSTFTEGVGKIDIGGEEIVGAVLTGGMGGVNIDCVISDGSDVVIKPFAPVERGVSSCVTRGVGREVSLTGGGPNKLRDGGGRGGGNDGRLRSEELAKKFGIPVEESFFCGVGGLRDMTGTAGWDTAGKTVTVWKLDLDDSGVKENGRAPNGGSLVGVGGATSATEVV